MPANSNAYIDVADAISVARRGQFEGDPRKVMALTATAALPAGVGVCFGADATKCKVPASSADVAAIQGCSVYNLGKPVASATNEYDAGEPVDVAAQGPEWVIVETDVTAGAVAYCRHTASANGTQLGAFRKDADTISSTDNAAATTARFLTSTTGAGVAKLGFNFPS